MKPSAISWSTGLMRYRTRCERLSPSEPSSLRGAQATKQSSLPCCFHGLLRGACHGARIRATRWLAMTGLVSLLFILRRVPQRVHLGERGAFERAVLRRERAFDIAEAPLEFGVGAAQRQIGIGADMPRQIDQREQEIAGFLGEFVGIAAVERGLDLVGFFADLVEYGARIVPVEADA